MLKMFNLFLKEHAKNIPEGEGRRRKYILDTLSINTLKSSVAQF